MVVVKVDSVHRVELGTTGGCECREQLKMSAHKHLKMSARLRRLSSSKTLREFLLGLVCGLGYRHFFARTPNRFLSAGGKMWGLSRRPPVPCNAPDSCAGRALRTGGAFLVGAGLEWSAGGVVAGEQAALITDAQSPVGELMDSYRAAHEMDALSGGGQLQNQVSEGDGIVVTHDTLMLAR